MSERDDRLIAEFNARHSEEAFAALVRQHVNLVFATALCLVGDAGAGGNRSRSIWNWPGPKAIPCGRRSCRCSMRRSWSCANRTCWC